MGYGSDDELQTNVFLVHPIKDAAFAVHLAAIVSLDMQTDMYWFKDYTIDYNAFIVQTSDRIR